MERTTTRSTRRRRGAWEVVGSIVGALALIVGGVAPVWAADRAPAAARAVAASALNGADFRPGLIISNSQFFNDDAMTAAQIQSFLQAKIGTCSNSYCLNVYRQSTSSRAADAYCKAYTGASNESAATIIAKVQAACGVSAKAILVTLQKEQGLVTNTAPSSSKLRIAMGYGCPDTAACDSLYYGFFNQVYSAARQFQRYGTGSFTWYPVGKTSSVRYNPNSACGSRSVLIENRATAALYYYTPYTPNAAALANLGGVGDSCSSYGNRNFWVFYSNWFGSPLAGEGEAAINYAYTAYGGASSPLGTKTSTTLCGQTSLSCSKTYEHGVITWTSADGAVIVSGAIGDYYLSKGGPSGSLGFPVKNAVEMDAGLNGGGFNQPFKNGFVSSSSFGTFALTGFYRTKHGALGGAAGPLGWPTAEKTCSLPSGACVQGFQHGSLLSASSSAAVYAVSDPGITQYWSAAGGAAGTLGVPTADAITVDSGSNGTGVSQMFAGGLVSAGPAGTFTIIGPLRTAHGARGGLVGPLGWPTAERTCGLAGGACSQPFQGGTLYASFIVSGAVTVVGIAVYHESTGGGTGSLGVPLKDAVPKATSANGAGYNQPFTNAFVSSSANGTFALIGAIRSAHGKSGGVAGILGWPTADQVCGLPQGGCSQQFQHGVIYTSGTVAGSITYEPIANYYASKGGPGGFLGYPTKGAVWVDGGVNGTGYNQPFQYGFVSSSSFGTFSLVGVIRKAHGDLGGVRSRIGWPIADQVCGLPSNGCSQQFQHGTITIDSKGIRVVYR